MTQIFDSKLKRFVDQAAAFPKTQAAEARAAGKTQDCGCEPKPAKQKRSSALDAPHRHYTLDNKGAWRVRKPKT